MKDLRTRRGSVPDVDLDGPGDWSRGETWDADAAIRGPVDLHVDSTRRGAPPR
jgi:hypothetical protein